jgi:hypothetical protein
MTVGSGSSSPLPTRHLEAGTPPAVRALADLQQIIPLISFVEELMLSRVAQRKVAASYHGDALPTSGARPKG